MDNHKVIMLIVIVLVAGFLLGSITGEAVKRRKQPPKGGGGGGRLTTTSTAIDQCKTRITTSGSVMGADFSVAYGPQIDGDTIVWFESLLDGYVLYSYSISSGTRTSLPVRLPTNDESINFQSLELKNNKVAYSITNETTFRSRIYWYDLTNGNSGFVPNTYNGELLRIGIYGPYFDIYRNHIVFSAAYANNLSGDGVYLYNLIDNTLKLVVSTETPGTPTIYGSNVSFDYGSPISDYLHLADISYLPSLKFIAIYNSGSGRTASDAMVYKTSVVFANSSRFNSNNTNVVLQEFKKIPKVIKVGKILYYNKAPVKIHENWLSWIEYDSTGIKSDVFVYNINNEEKTQLTFGLTGSAPDISNNKLVYLSSEAYADQRKDVYLYDLTCL